MNELEFQKFLTEEKSYGGKKYSNAQLIAWNTAQKVFRGNFDKMESLTPEQESYYSEKILGDFIKSNPNGNYRFTEEEKKYLATLESTLKNKYKLSDKQVKKYWDYLMDERQKLENHYLNQVDTFYHLSHISPDKLHPCKETGEIGIDLKECKDAYYQMTGNFCYVAPKGVIPLCLRPFEMKMYPYLNPSFVVVCTAGQDFEKTSLTCYEYEVEKSKSIRPLVMPWGNEPVEYISTRPLKITNLDNPKVQTPKTLTQNGLKIFLIDDRDFYKQQTKSLMLNNLSTKEQEAHFLNLTKTHPDKIRLYNPKQGKILEKQKSEASR